MSGHATPASASAACAATTPYSTKLRPHLPHGCMPAPRMAMSCSLTACSSVPQWCPLPDDVLVLVVFVERARARAPSPCRPRARSGSAPVASPPSTTICSTPSSTAHTVYGTNGIGRHVRLGRRVVVRRPRPQLPGARQLDRFAFLARRARVARDRDRGRPVVRARLHAARAEQRRRRLVGREPVLDGRHSRLAHASSPRCFNVCSASLMMRAINSATLGRSSITPAT